MAIERWNYQETEHREPFAGKAFVSIDPGADGYALGWLAGDPIPLGYCAALQPQALVALAERVRARVFVVEGQFIGNTANAGSVLDLSFRMGIAIGWVAAVLHGSLETKGDVHLFTVPPSTWQARQRRKAGIPGRLPRKEGLALTVERAARVFAGQPEWDRASKKQREGMGSALGIGEWWRYLTTGG